MGKGVGVRRIGGGRRRRGKMLRKEEVGVFRWVGEEKQQERWEG